MKIFITELESVINCQSPQKMLEYRNIPCVWRSTSIIDGTEAGLIKHSDTLCVRARACGLCGANIRSM